MLECSVYFILFHTCGRPYSWLLVVQFRVRRLSVLTFIDYCDVVVHCIILYFRAVVDIRDEYRLSI